MGTKELIQKLAGINDALVPVEIELLEVEDDLYPERDGVTCLVVERIRQERPGINDLNHEIDVLKKHEAAQ